MTGGSIYLLVTVEFLLVVYSYSYGTYGIYTSHLDDSWEQISLADFAFPNAIVVFALDPNLCSCAGTETLQIITAAQFTQEYFVSEHQ